MDFTSRDSWGLLVKMGFRFLRVSNFEGGNQLESCGMRCGWVWLNTHSVNRGRR